MYRFRLTILARCILQNTTRRLWSLVRILSRLSLCTRHTYIGILGSRYYYFLYTTYHTPSNTKSSELHFCVRNNSGNSGIHMDGVCCSLLMLPLLSLLLLNLRCLHLPLPLLWFLLLWCCSSVVGVAHGPPFFFLLFYSTIHDGKIARSLRCSVSAGNIKPPSSCTPRQLRRPL